jgi:hydroxyacylglutathione hydrolase
MTEPAAYFKQLALGPMANFVYLIGDPGTKEAAVIDPAWDVSAILEEARKDGMEIRHILATHGHPDHINAVQDLARRTGARVYLHEQEMPWEEEWDAPVHRTRDGERIKIGNLEVTCLHTPGHSPGSQCFLAGSWLFSGDTLFVGACGRTDLPGGDPRQLYESLRKLADTLPGQTVVCPGHDYGGAPNSTLSEQKENNPFLQMGSLSDFLRMFGP